MTSHELERQYLRMVGMLRKELEGHAGSGIVEAVGRKHFERLRSGATINDFIPLLVYRATRDELSAAIHTDGNRAELSTAA